MPEQKESAQAVAQAQNPEANASTSTVNYTTQSPECQLGELSSLEAIESFLRAQAEERILRARQALADARGEIEKARAEREKAIQAKRAEVAQKEEEKKSLRPKVQDLIARAEAILTDDEMATKVVARIIEAGEKEKKALQHSLRGHKAALRRLEAHHAEATPPKCATSKHCRSAASGRPKSHCTKDNRQLHYAHPKAATCPCPSTACAFPKTRHAPPMLKTEYLDELRRLH